MALDAASGSHRGFRIARPRRVRHRNLPPAGHAVRPAEDCPSQDKEEILFLPENRFVALRLQKLARHPRYFATFIQLIGAALVFRSWGGVVLAVVIGLPLLLVQARHEDAHLKDLLKNELKAYTANVPAFWPRFR